MDLLIRADAAPAMGSGHIMRCRALAAAARQAGLRVVLGGRCGIDWLRPVLEQEGFFFLEGLPPREEDPQALLDDLRRMAGAPLADRAVVLDGYHFTGACQNAVHAAVRALLVVDDYCHLPHYTCNILLNTNPGSESCPYAGTIGRKLLGLDYALLRPEFQHPPAASNPANILLTLGGGDFSAFLPQLLPALALPAMTGRRLRVLAGSMPPASLRLLEALPVRLEILPRVDDMPSLLAETQLCLSAGGSTCWELCRMGVPFLTVEVADNQRAICSWLDAQGYAPRFSLAAFADLLENEERRRQLSGRLRQLVDGRGAARVVEQLSAVNRS